jgi:hypothetical protein
LRSRLFILLFTLISAISYAQVIANKASLIGENEKEYEQMMTECSTPLLFITNNSMDEAYKLWTKMLAKMEADASEQGIDIKGVKVWMNLFWEADGSIKKIVYYPKPNSKNMDFDQLTSFLQIFADSYVLDISHSTCFSHYGSATFPVFTKITLPNEK